MTAVTNRPSLRARIARPVAVTTTLVVLVPAAFVASLAVGGYPVPVADVVPALLGGGDTATSYGVTELRLPRAAIGLLVGACLALAGALTQSFTRNPLASPDVLGVTGGASAAAVAAIVLGGGTYRPADGWAEFGVPIAALIGALVAAAAVFGLAWRGGLPGNRVVLVGIGVAAMGTALVSWLLIAASIGQAGSAAVWLTGSLNARGFEQLWPLLAAVVVLFPAASALQRPLSAAALGDDVGRGLGLRLRSVQGATIVVAALLTGAAVASAGPVQFVALVGPQVALRLVGRADIPLVASAATGALLVLVADLVGRSVASFEIPVGLITAGVGAIYLIGLLSRHRSEVSA